MAHWVSADLKNWTELPEPFIVPDKGTSAQICPNWFKWNDWYYFLGSNNVWRSREPYGPWTLQTPRPLDSLMFPKTGEFTGNRRLYAGWLADGRNSFGGNIVLREMVQFADGTLGTRFVPEMIPPSGEPIALRESERNVRLESKTEPRQILLDHIPNNSRITLTLAPQGPVKAYGLRLRTSDGKTDGTEFRLTTVTAQAS